MKKNTLFILGLSLLSVISCSKNDDGLPEPQNVPVAYTDGVFVLNEGNFQQGNSSVTFISEDFSKVAQDIFRKANEGNALGDTATDIGFYEDFAFIVVNVSNKVIVVDRSNWEQVVTIEDQLENPRKIAFSGGKAYVTNWGDGTDPTDDYIAVYEIPGFTLTAKISVEEGPDEIISSENELYVAHPGGFSFGNTISVIDSHRNEVSATIPVGDVPNALALQGDKLWVLSNGLPFYADGGETAGSLSKVDLTTGEVVEEFEFKNTNDHPSNLKANNGSLFYTMGNKVFKFSSEEGLSEMPFLEPQEINILYGFEIFNNKIFIASANTYFSGRGKLFVYDFISRDLIDSFETGVNPNGIFPND